MNKRISPVFREKPCFKEMMPMNVFLHKILITFFLLLPSAYALAETDIPHNDLSVQIDLEKKTITGVSRISLPAEKTARIFFTGIQVTAVSLQDRKLIVEPGTESLIFTPGTDRDVLTIEYTAEYPLLPEREELKNFGVIHGNHIRPEGIMLTEQWHPFVEGYSYYRLAATLPGEFECISAADSVHIRKRADSSREILFDFEHPLQTLTLVAGRYEVETERHGDIEIATYFFKEDSVLAKTYRESAKKYLDMYGKILGRYPFRRFAVVENFVPAGSALPTVALFGKDIVKMPFILDTSLGHEILHQWFGNLVYSDDKAGNWAEGLTTYLSDHLYEEMNGRGWNYRKQILVSFENFVTAENEYPLQSFSGRQDRVSAAIGYGKSAMVFHMLRNMIGDEIFFSALRKFIEKNSFKAASWAELREAFEAAYGNNLDWFFKQWIEEGGLPDISIENLELKYRGAKVVVSFDIKQKAKNFKLLLPVSLKLREGEVRRVFTIDKESTSVEMETGETPVSLILDDDYDVFRRLSEKESPPVISRLLGDEKRLFVIPRDTEGVYKDFSAYLSQEGFTEKKESELSHEDIKNSSLLIPGVETGIVKRLLGKLEVQAADYTLITRENPFNKKGVIVVIETPFPLGLVNYFQKITHYGNYSDLSFAEDRNISKTVNETERGIRVHVLADTLGVEIPRITDIYRVIEKVADKDIIYVGEAHDRLEHHRVQLQVIMALYKKYKKIAIGMEMFQHPFQQTLDDYTTGEIDEKTFLKKSEYFQRWGFDYNLYREILLFAREYKIPVIALNIKKEIISKVSREGMQSLTDEELKEVPEYFDLSDMDYRERLRGFFEQHTRAMEKNFDFFYQSQVLWDESMSHNLNAFMKKNPDYKIIVLTGVGHMAYGSGIPKRTFRRNGKEYAVILNTGDIEKDVADFVLFPAPVALPESPKLMVQLKEEDKKVIISQFAPDSIAEKAGLQEDDVILSLDDTIVEGIADVRIFLFFKKKGDEITITVSRKRFLFGPKERRFKVTL